MSFGSALRNHPHFLEQIYRFTHWGFEKLDPILKGLGYDRSNRLIDGPEDMGKELLFDCRMCGQCILHSTGMTCPMSCPKNLRNGPCGGVRGNGHCEVKPEMKCVWTEAYERSLKMPVYGQEIIWIQPPVNRQLEGTSAWVNMLTGVDKQTPKGWEGNSKMPSFISVEQLEAHWNGGQE
ncbi:MAG: methylenetetrahydrofolate reductase C-terminal domain-containing protein [Caldilineales bacterium]|nr:methylenetetrahydrofolate reductase C-terminal domain-containing protein [Caldilineales bacterium]